MHRLALRLKSALMAMMAAIVLVAAVSSPASAATTSVRGTLSCPAGKVVWVTVQTETYAAVSFYAGSRLKYTTGATSGYVTHNYEVQSVSWRVDSSGDIRAQHDYCAPARLRVVGSE